MIETYIGNEGLEKTWQADFPKTAKCQCGGEARHAFTVFEDGEKADRPAGNLPPASICQLHPNDPDGDGFWLHDVCAVAVYFCKKCLNPVAKYNQA